LKKKVNKEKMLRTGKVGNVPKSAWIVVVTVRETKTQFATTYHYDKKVPYKQALLDAMSEFPEPDYLVFVGG
jgi:hypothetical protein